MVLRIRNVYEYIMKGVRYNAEKKKIGNYYSTPILQFRMRCHLCSNWIEIHTDPKVRSLRLDITAASDSNAR